MNTNPNITAALAIGLHALTAIANGKGRTVRAKDIAESLNVSYNHLSKVLQMLVKDGIISSTKGPSGGFVLARKPDQIILKDIYEAIEGPLNQNKCLFGKDVCPAGKCVFESFIAKINEEFIEYFNTKKLSDILN